MQSAKSCNYANKSTRVVRSENYGPIQIGVLPPPLQVTFCENPPTHLISLEPSNLLLQQIAFIPQKQIVLYLSGTHDWAMVTAPFKGDDWFVYSEMYARLGDLCHRCPETNHMEMGFLGIKSALRHGNVRSSAARWEKLVYIGATIWI